jgi:Uma2 family endonuclease
MKRVVDMALAPQQKWLTEQQYLDAELTSAVKHELIDGECYAMAGASMNHVRLCGNVFAEFRQHLKGTPCQAAASDMKVKAQGKTHANFFYPDVVVDCDFDESEPYITQSPVIIVEVLSKSTRRTDQTTKRMQYINLPSLKEYVLIEQDIVDIEVLRKTDDWRSRRYFLGDEITFDSIGLTLSVADIYERVHNDEMLAFIEQVT